VVRIVVVVDIVVKTEGFAVFGFFSDGLYFEILVIWVKECPLLVLLKHLD